jgi:Anaerobic dehydrogenases, typically selenocysteine-containing
MGNFKAEEIIKDNRVYEEDGYTVVRTCAWSPPGDHPVGCGLKLYVKDNKLVKVEGDEEQPVSQGRLCIRCLTLPEYVHHPDRIIYPLQRAGKRGENKWKRISWEEAYDIIVEKAKYYTENYGPESISTFVGTGREACTWISAFTWKLFGTPNKLYCHSGFSCYGPRCMVTMFALGAGYPEIDYAGQYADRYDHLGYKLPEYIVIWGKAPLESNPDGLFGHAIIDMMKRGSKLMVVDPRVTWLASRAEYFCQLRPGTDTALAMGMLNVIINEELYDKEFVEKWCYGFDKLKERVQEMTPAKAAEITWVPEETIMGAARAFATGKPSNIAWGLATDQKPNGLQMAHALIALLAITGNVDVPGGVIIGGNAALNGFEWGWEDLPEELQHKAFGFQEYPAFVKSWQYAQPDVALEQLETGKPYTVKMGYFNSTNVIANPAAVPDRWHEALQNLEFAFATDIFMNPTIMAYCDLVLPLTTFAEHNSTVATQYGTVSVMIGAINKALQVGECKFEADILVELGHRINPDAFPWNNSEEMIDEVRLKPSLGMTYRELREVGWAQFPYKYRKYETGELRTDGQPGFNTPTGKVELYSTIFESLGEDPLPYYEEPPYSPFSTPELGKEYPLVLTTGARSYAYFHSEQRQIPTLRELYPDPMLEINSDTAAKLGIKDGDWVWIENMIGKCKQRAKVTEGIHPNVVHGQHGWWFPERQADAPNLYGVFESNINMLIPNHTVGKLGFGAPYKCMICKVYKVEQEVKTA